MKKNTTIIPITVMITVILPVIFATLLTGGCSGKHNEKKSPQLQQQPVKVVVHRAVPGTLVRNLQYKGMVAPWRRANIGPETSGRVRKIFKKQGDPVKKGELLAQLDTVTTQLQLKQAQASLEAAGAAHKDAMLTARRMENLYQKDAVSKIQLEKARLNLENTRTQEKNAGALVALLRHTLDRAHMRAPFAGIITSKNCEEGDMLNPMMGMGSSVLTLMQLDRVKVLLDVPPGDIQHIRTGQPCTLQVPTATGETFQGRVHSHNLAADPASNTFRVEILAENPEMLIKAGILARVNIEISRRENCLTLPLSALLDRGVDGADRARVVLYDNGRARYRDVGVGAENDRVAEITAGLDVGMRVVVEGNYDLVDGALITYEETEPGKEQEKGQ